MIRLTRLVARAAGAAAALVITLNLISNLFNGAPQ